MAYSFYHREGPFYPKTIPCQYVYIVNIVKYCIYCKISQQEKFRTISSSRKKAIVSFPLNGQNQIQTKLFFILAPYIPEYSKTRQRRT